MIKAEVVKKVACPQSANNICRALEKTLSTADFKKSASVAVNIVGRAEIRRLNKKYRFQDKVTDVLSFPLLSNDFVILPKQPIELGDIVICYPQIIKQAKEFKRSVKYEFNLMLVHGALHLLGYDHERSLKQEKIMTALTNKTLKLLGFKVD